MPSKMEKVVKELCKEKRTVGYIKMCKVSGVSMSSRTQNIPRFEEEGAAVQTLMWVHKTPSVHRHVQTWSIGQQAGGRNLIIGPVNKLQFAADWAVRISRFCGALDLAEKTTVCADNDREWGRAQL